MTRRSWCCLVFVFHGDAARAGLGACQPRCERHARPGLFGNLERRVLQTQFPSSVELRSCLEYGVRRRHSDASAANANPSAIPINGLSAANQKDTFQPGLSAVRFLFIFLLQVFGGGHFRKTKFLLPRFAERDVGAQRDRSPLRVLAASRLVSHAGALTSSLKRGSKRSGSNIGSRWSSAEVSGESYPKSFSFYCFGAKEATIFSKLGSRRSGSQKGKVLRYP